MNRKTFFQLNYVRETIVYEAFISQRMDMEENGITCDMTDMSCDSLAIKKIKP